MSKKEEEIDLNEYREFINIDYVVSMKKQKERLKSYYKFINEESKNTKNVMVVDEYAKQFTTQEELNEYYEDLEYSGLKNEHRYVITEEEKNRRKELNRLSNESFIKNVEKFGLNYTQNLEYKEYSKKIQKEFEEGFRNPPKISILVDDKVHDAKEYFDKLIGENNQTSIILKMPTENFTLPPDYKPLQENFLQFGPIK